MLQRTVEFLRVYEMHLPEPDAERFRSYCGLQAVDEESESIPEQVVNRKLEWVTVFAHERVRAISGESAIQEFGPLGAIVLGVVPCSSGGIIANTGHPACNVVVALKKEVESRYGGRIPRNDVDDVVQDFFEILFSRILLNNISSLTSKGEPEQQWKFLKNILLNRKKTVVRRTHRHRESALATEPASRDTPRHTSEDVWQAISQNLSAIESDAIRQRFRDCSKSAEIAKSWECPVDKVYKILNSALTKLRGVPDLQIAWDELHKSRRNCLGNARRQSLQDIEYGSHEDESESGSSNCLGGVT